MFFNFDPFAKHAPKTPALSHAGRQVPAGQADGLGHAVSVGHDSRGLESPSRVTPDERTPPGCTPASTHPCSHAGSWFCNYLLTWRRQDRTNVSIQSHIWW